MQPPLKRLLTGIGSVLAVAGLVFVAIRLYEYAPQLDGASFSTALLLQLLGLAVVYGCANVLLALAWRDVLRQLGHPILSGLSVRIYGQSHIAKYAPGNIFHLASRQILGLSAGIPGRALAKSMGLELILLVVSGALLVGLFLQNWISTHVGALAWWGPAILVALGALAIHRWQLVWFARALLLQLLFLVISAVVYWVLLSLLASPVNATAMPTGLVLGAATAAWLLGLVTPGAPAGLGVREAVLVLILGAYFSEADLVLAVVLARVVNILGDVGFFAASFAWSKIDTQPTPE